MRFLVAVKAMTSESLLASFKIHKTWELFLKSFSEFFQPNPFYRWVVTKPKEVGGFAWKPHSYNGNILTHFLKGEIIFMSAEQYKMDIL